MPLQSPSLSSRITNPLREVTQRQWTVLAARGVLQTLAASLAVLLAISMLLGWFTGMPVTVRIIVAAATWAGVIWAAVHCLRPTLKRWSLSRAAQMAELSLPDSQERISSAVELSESEDPFRGSAELVAHLVKQAEQDVARVKVGEVIPMRSIFVWALVFVPVIVAWTLLALDPHTNKMLLRGLFSTLTPWQAPPIALADIAVKPGDVVMAQGDALEIIAIVSPDGGKLARSANLIRIFGTGQSTSENLEQVKGTQFASTLDNLQQSFKYRIHTDRGDSTTYSVTVNPRPAIARLDVHYEYPKYTGIDAKTEIASDGNIDVIAGTRITLAITTTESLVNGKSFLVFNDGQPDSTTLALAPTSEKNVYHATFDVTQKGNYRARLLNEYNLANKDDAVRAINAEIDQPPTISIQSPKEQITVRPDDDVTVMYVAGDDYGVAGIEALVQVDDQPEHTVAIVIHGPDRKHIKEQWTLSLPTILRLAGVPEAARVTYQLKATDNRDPDPQTALSVRRVLVIDKYQKQSFEDKLNEMRKADLQAAIRKAIQRLSRDLDPIARLRSQASRHAVEPAQLLVAGELREHLSTTGKELSATAADYLDTPFAEVARAAQSISEKDIAKSADDTARMILDLATPDTARQDGDHAYSEVVQARDDLQKLLEEVEQAEKKAEAVRELKDAAKEQAQVAKAMEEHPENVDQNRQKQLDAINKLQEAIQKDPSLQNQQARQNAQKLAELENKIEQDQQKQTELQNQTAKQEQQQQAEKSANAIADQQKKLNQDVQQFAKDDQKLLDQAQAQPPNQNQQNQLVQNIEKNQLQSAAKEAQQAADQLKQDAQKLADQAKNATPPTTADEQKQQQQDQQNAQDAQAQADQAAQDLKHQADQQQQNADTNKQSAQKTEQAADAIAKAADKIEQQNQDGAKNADVKKAADAAKADAQQASQDAQAAAQDQNPQDAQKAETKAAQEVAKASQELNQAAQAQAKAGQAQAQQQNQQAAAQAANQAQSLAQRQQDIAKAIQQQAAAGQQGEQTPDQAAQKQQQLAQQTQQAQQVAEQLGQQAKAQQNPALAQRADQAAQALADAAKDQQQAAQADAQGKPADAGQAQAEANQALSKADQALRGHPQDDSANAGPGQPGQGQGQPSQSAAQAAQEAAQAQQQALQPNAAAAANAAQALAQAAQSAEQGLPGQSGPGEPGQEPGQEPGLEPGQDPAAHPAPGTDPKKGIAGQDSGGDNKAPASVAALGISGSDWVKLGKNMQQQLLTASQQTGPPAYKEMIKNYYIRVARMQNDPAEAEPKQ